MPLSENTVRITSKLPSTEVWGGHPAARPISGSLAYLYKDPASDSRHGRSMSRSVTMLNSGDSIYFQTVSQTSRSIIQNSVADMTFILIMGLFSSSILPAGCDITIFYSNINVCRINYGCTILMWVRWNLIHWISSNNRFWSRIYPATVLPERVVSGLWECPVDIRKRAAKEGDAP